MDRIVNDLCLTPPTCQLVYKVDGEHIVFNYDKILKLYNRGRNEEYCEKLDKDFLIEDILNQSAPDIIEDAIVRSCQHLQSDPICSVYHIFARIPTPNE